MLVLDALRPESMKPLLAVIRNVQVFNPLRKNVTGLRVECRKGQVGRGSIIPRLLKVTVLLALLPSRAAPTSLVVAFLRQGGSETVVFAADSLVTGFGSHNECKIFLVRNCVFMTSGLTAYTPTEFNADDIARQACAEIGRPSIKARAFVRLVGDRLSDAVLHAMRDAPIALDPYKNDLPILTAVFSVINGGKPGCAIIKYRLGVGDKVNLAPVVDIDLMPDDAGLFANKPAVSRFLEVNPNWMKHFGLADATREIVRMEIQDRPSQVGPPVSVLVIQNTGAKWVNYGLCKGNNRH